jgi:hypothetical protein
MNEMISKIAENKINYHLAKSKLPFEEKFKIIISLQVIDFEFRKNNSHKKMQNYYRIWQ